MTVSREIKGQRYGGSFGPEYSVQVTPSVEYSIIESKYYPVVTIETRYAMMTPEKRELNFDVGFHYLETARDVAIRLAKDYRTLFLEELERSAQNLWANMPTPRPETLVLEVEVTETRG